MQLSCRDEALQEEVKGAQLTSLGAAVQLGQSYNTAARSRQYGGAAVQP